MADYSLLIVDDDPIVHGLYKASLSGFPIECESAMSGEEGLKRVSKSRYDMLLLDIMMPGGNGLDFLRAMETNHITMPLIVVCSSISDKKYVMRAFSLGASGYLIKPLKPSQLQETVTSCLLLEPNEQEAVDKQPSLLFPSSQNKSGSDGESTNKVIKHVASLTKAMAEMFLGKASGEVVVVTDKGIGCFMYKSGRLLKVSFGDTEGLIALETINQLSHSRITLTID
jgi:CheY-like chemotaxis protein